VSKIMGKASGRDCISADELLECMAVIVFELREEGDSNLLHLQAVSQAVVEQQTWGG
jgi:hypothetical protein